MKTLAIDQVTPTSPDGYTKRVLRQNPNGLVFTLTFQPGQTLAPHQHEQSDLTVVVMEGEGTATAAGARQPISRGSVLLCEGQEPFGVENTGTGRLVLLAVLHPAPSNPAFARDTR